MTARLPGAVRTLGIARAIPHRDPLVMWTSEPQAHIRPRGGSKEKLHETPGMGAGRLPALTSHSLE